MANYNPLTLAYIGDGVFEILVRMYLLQKKGIQNANKLHKKAATLVNAKAQAVGYHIVLPLLTEAEVKVLKSGRNATSHTSAKNATISDYRHATGLEALFGYLHLNKQFSRINDLFDLIINELEKYNNNKGEIKWQTEETKAKKQASKEANPKTAQETKQETKKTDEKTLEIETLKTMTELKNLKDTAMDTAEYLKTVKIKRATGVDKVAVSIKVKPEEKVETPK